MTTTVFIEYLDKYNYKNEYYSNNVLSFLDSINIKTRVDKDRIYPFSNKAESVKKAYEFALNKYKVKIILNSYIKNIDLVNDKYNILGTYYDYVILATGGKVGCIYNGYSLVEDLKIKCSKLYPALVGFKVREKITSLDGVRMLGEVSCGLFKEIGEVQFKKDGISGIVIMNLSRIVNEGIIQINFGLGIEKSYFYENTKEKVLSMFPIKLAQWILESDNIIENIYNMKFNIRSDYGFEQAQITKGGILMDELNEGFELKKYKNLYAIGELIDVDGECGGYNIHNAIASGLISGKYILNKIVK